MSSLTLSSHFQVSITSFKLLNTQAIIESVGPDLVLRASVDHLASVARGNLHLDDFQSKFAAGELDDALANAPNGEYACSCFLFFPAATSSNLGREVKNTLNV